MIGIIESFEDQFVIIEVEGKMKDVRKQDVDEEAKAGDVVELLDGKWKVNKELTRKRSESVKELMEELWEDD